MSTQLWQSNTSRQSTQSGSTLTKHLSGSCCKSVHESLPESSKVVTGQTCLYTGAVRSITARHSPAFSLMHVGVSRASFHAMAQRLVLVIPAEDRPGKDPRKMGLLKRSMCMNGTIDAASNWERDWQGHVEKSGLRSGAQFKELVS